MADDVIIISDNNQVVISDNTTTQSVVTDNTVNTTAAITEQSITVGDQIEVVEVISAGPQGIPGNLTSVGLTMPLEYVVSNSPLTSNGTIVVTKATGAANLFYGTPNGSAGQPSLRAIVPADIPFIQGASGTQVVYTSGFITVSSSASIDNILVPAEFTVNVDHYARTATITKATELANTAWMGPVSGGAAQPTFRAIQGQDLSTVIGASGIQVSLVGNNLQISASGLTGNLGTVTSVNASVPAEFSVSGIPITTSGTITIVKNVQPANTFWGGGVSSSSTPFFRNIVAQDLFNISASTGIALNVIGSTLVITATGSGGGTGSVTSVALAAPVEYSISGSPVTSTGTLTFSKVSQNANLVWAGPISGSAAIPYFRQLVGQDLTNILGASGIQVTVSGSSLVISASSLTGNLGTVTSVSLSAPSEFAVSGSPVTTSGTLTLTKSTEPANTFWAGPISGSVDQPYFRSIVGADLFNILASSGISLTRVGSTLVVTATGTNSGTVTSVNASVPPEFSVSGVPITGSGTIVLDKSNEPANSFWGGPQSGPNDKPWFRNIVAADLSNIVAGNNVSISTSGSSLLISASISGSVQSAATTPGNLPVGVPTNVVNNGTALIPQQPINFTGISASSVYEYAVSASGQIIGVCAGPDGNIWFTERNKNKIGKVTPLGVVTEYVSPANQPQSICAGPDGNLWFTASAGAGVGIITPSGSGTTLGIGTFINVCAGPDGNMWFIGSTSIKKVATSGAVLATYGANGNAICTGPDGNLWYTGNSSQIVKITTSGVSTFYNEGGDSTAFSPICSGPDGNLWSVVSAGGATSQVIKITTSGIITKYSTVLPFNFMSICSGPDGNLWVNGGSNSSGGNSVYKVSTSGIFTQCATTGISNIYGSICSGPDGNIWFTSQSNTQGLGINTIGKISLGYNVGTLSVNDSISLPLASGSILIGNASGRSTAVPIVGDASIYLTGSSGQLVLANTGVTPGSYHLTDLTVDNKGRLTSASNGSIVAADLFNLGASTGIAFNTVGSKIFIAATGQLTGTNINSTVPPEFSVSGVPITNGVGTIAISKNTEPANTFWAGPISGSVAQPYFRSIVGQDLFNILASSGIALTQIGSTLTVTATGHLTGTNINASVPPEFLVSGVPITNGVGTIAITKNNEPANTFWAGPISGSAAQPYFRSIVGQDLFNILASSGIALTQTGSTLVVTATGQLTSTNINATVPPEFTVTGVPITNGVGTIAISKSNENANTFFAGPVSGSPTQPWFRNIVAKDLFNISASTGLAITTVGSTLVMTVTGSGGVGGGTVTSVGLSTPSEFVWDGVPVSTSGNLTFSKASQISGKIWAGPVKSSATFCDFVEFRVPTATSQPSIICLGPDNNLWFTEFAGGTNGKIGQVTTAGVFTEFALSVVNSQPLGICAGPDGNLWFTESGGNKIGKITTAGVITEFTIPTASSVPRGICLGPDNNLWFVEGTGNKIGKVTTAGVFTEFTIPTGTSNPQEICSGPDGNLWFTEFAGNKIGKITTSGTITEYTIPTGSSQPIGICSGPDGNLWFCESNTNKIGQVTTAGVFTEFTVPTGSSNPRRICLGPDNNLWFTEFAGGTNGKIGQVTTAGVFTEFTVPTGSSNPSGICAGPDGNLWFTESGGNKVGLATPIVTHPLITDLPTFRNLDSLDYYDLSNLFNARLSTTRGTAIVTSSATSSYVYLTAYSGNLISLYNPSASTWHPVPINTDLQLPIYSASGNINYDVFINDRSSTDASTLLLSASAWYSTISTNNPAAGSSVALNVANTSNFAVGDWITIQGKTASGLRSEVQVIASISVGVSVTVTTLSNTYTGVVQIFSNRVRSASLTLQDGVYVDSNDKSHRYVGTIRTSNINYTDGTTMTVEDSTSRRFVWNYYNRVERPMLAQDPAVSWTYAVATIRASDANTTDGQGRFSFVVGISEDPVQAYFQQSVSETGIRNVFAGIGLDSTTTTKSYLGNTVGGQTSGGNTNQLSQLIVYNDYPGIGFHFLQMLESTNATTTFFGTQTQPNNNSWMNGTIRS